MGVYRNGARAAGIQRATGEAFGCGIGIEKVGLEGAGLGGKVIFNLTNHWTERWVRSGKAMTGSAMSVILLVWLLSSAVDL